MIKKTLFAIAIMAFNFCTSAQDNPFSIELEPVSIPELGGIQSFSFGQANGKWLIVGGRLDGLHRRQPWASFDVAGHNDRLIVVDPESMEQWSAPLTSLPVGVQEQLSSTNMNYHQEGDYLYCIGGYGYSPTEGDHTTYSYLTAIDVPEAIEAIINGTDFSSAFRQISDPQFQVTGGRLKKIYEVYHILGGQKFLGRYNPMNNPTFTQEYTNQIRRFTLNDDGTTMNIQFLPAFSDPLNLHRRDYNAEPQILPNGEEGITLFSGVFQPTADLPFLNSVTVDSTNFLIDDTFQQYFNHYHCPVIPLYAAESNEMHTLFFGGIAQYYEDNGVLVQDNDVPFVKTIARVTRDASGKMEEYKLPVEMPSYLGAGAEFLPNKELPHYNNEVLKLDELSSGKVLLGYIYGGINSPDANIFWINDGTQSTANNQIFKVYLNHTFVSVEDLKKPDTGSLQLRVYPNPNNGIFLAEYVLSENTAVEISLFDIDGKQLESTVIDNQTTGKHSYRFSKKENLKGGVFIITLKTAYETATQKIVLNQ
jgi:hypothetical protein